MAFASHASQVTLAQRMVSADISPDLLRGQGSLSIDLAEANRNVLGSSSILYGIRFYLLKCLALYARPSDVDLVVAYLRINTCRCIIMCYALLLIFVYSNPISIRFERDVHHSVHQTRRTVQYKCLYVR